MDIAIYLLFVLLTLLSSDLGRRLSRVNRRLTAMERKLDLLARHAGVEDDTVTPGMEQVAALARQGKKIQAIKAYREVTGADLVEAKQAVERM